MKKKRKKKDNMEVRLWKSLEHSTSGYSSWDIFFLRTIVLTSGGRMFGNFNPYLYGWYFQERSGDLKGGTSESSNKEHLRLS